MKIHLVLMFVALVLAAPFGLRAQLDPLDGWDLMNPKPQVLTTDGIAYGGGYFVAVGGPGGITTSTDAAAWKFQTAPTTNYLTGVAFDRSLFVATEWNPQDKAAGILTSSDGANWTRQPLGDKADYLWWVGAANNQFIAVGGTGALRISPDGTNWTQAVSQTQKSLYGAAYGNGVYVVVGQSGTIRTSPDTTNWASQASPTPASLLGVAFGKGAFAALCATNIIITSSDGTNWTKQVIAKTNILENIIFADDRFVAVGQHGAIAISTDGSNWQPEYSGTRDDFFTVTYGGGRFAAIGARGVVVTSSDGTAWAAHNPGDTRSLADVAYGNHAFVAVGDAFSNLFATSDQTVQNPAILTSWDGANWMTIDPGTTNLALLGVAFVNGSFVAVGETGSILTSSNGVSWVQRNVSTFPTNQIYYPFAGVAYGGGLYLAVSEEFGTNYLTSPDSISWTGRSFPDGIQLRRVRYVNGIFIGLGYNRDRSKILVVTSPDGLIWTKQKPANAGNLPNDVAYGRGLYVIVGDLSSVQISTNAVHWTLVKSPLLSSVSANFHSIEHHGGVFVAATDAGPFSSTDGVNWVRHATPGRVDLRGVVYGDGSFVAVGSRGGIFRSGIVMTLDVLNHEGDAGDELEISGRAGAAFRLQGSTDLRSWSDLSTVTNPSESTQITVTNGPNASTRFYRATIP